MTYYCSLQILRLHLQYISIFRPQKLSYITYIFYANAVFLYAQKVLGGYFLLEILIRDPTCTRAWNLLIMAIIIKSMIVLKVIIFVVYVPTIMKCITKLRIRFIVKRKLNEKFYNTKLTDPNYDLNKFVLYEQKAQDLLQFNDIELKLLNEKFLYKNTNTNEKQHDEEESQVQKDTELCQICNTEFKNDNLPINLPGCKDRFHFECIKPWLQRDPKCPQCGNNVRIGMFRQLRDKSPDWNINENNVI